MPAFAESNPLNLPVLLKLAVVPVMPPLDVIKSVKVERPPTDNDAVPNNVNAVAVAIVIPPLALSNPVKVLVPPIAKVPPISKFPV